ncbi:DNA-binding transcriptional LysR family regulator [Paraburkholderia sp. EB58]|uniref:hypothetical protein n=1 Tax=Paraburkholderia sp. EB58 TaxID=3035125 RepID=UPI003D1D2F0E
MNFGASGHVAHACVNRRIRVAGRPLVGGQSPVHVAVVRVLEDFSTPERSIHLLYRAARALALKVRAFIEYSLNELGIADDSDQRDVA